MVWVDGLVFFLFFGSRPGGQRFVRVGLAGKQAFEDIVDVGPDIEIVATEGKGTGGERGTGPVRGGERGTGPVRLPCSFPSESCQSMP